MPTPPRDVKLVILGAACAPALHRALLVHLQPLQRDSGWAVLPSVGPRRLAALRQATVVLLLRGPASQRGEGGRSVIDSDEIRDLLDEALASEQRLVQMAVGSVALHDELDRLPMLTAEADPDSAAVAALEAVIARASSVPQRASYGRGVQVVRPDLLGIDRKQQWRAICDAAEERRHLALLVLGATQEGHRYFQARVHFLWPRRRARVYELAANHPVHGFASRDKLFAAVAQAVAAARDAAAGLAQALHAGDVVLLWPVLHAGSYDPELLREALWEWLPVLLAQAEQHGLVQTGYLRVVVNLEWPRVAGWAKLGCPLVPPFLRVGGLRWAEQRRRLRRCSDRLVRERGALRVQRLGDLQPIPRADVIAHLASLKKEDGDLLRPALDVAQDSRELFERLQEAALRGDG